MQQVFQTLSVMVQGKERLQKTGVVRAVSLAIKDE